MDIRIWSGYLQSMMELPNAIQKQSFVAVDTETTGKYPIDAEICEIAAIKWQGGEIVGEFQRLVKPTSPMSQEVIKIHNITNDMVANAPPIADVIGDFHSFIDGSVPIAHHAPFDMGFLCIEFERHKLSLPNLPVLCTSLLSRALIKGTANHRLQTLAAHFGIDSGQAHRALDDAVVCMKVAEQCFVAAAEKVGASLDVDKLVEIQGKKLVWRDYAVSPFLNHPILGPMVTALESGARIRLVYNGGSRPGKSREVQPLGLVRNSGQDFLVAMEQGHPVPKRYILNKITKTSVVS